jgi:hypothetical protein
LCDVRQSDVVLYWELAEDRRSTTAASDAVATRIRSVRARRDRPVKALEEGAAAYPAVAARLTELENQHRELRQHHAAVLDAERAKGVERVQKPDPTRLLAAFGNMEAILMQTPAVANQALLGPITSILEPPSPSPPGSASASNSP